MKLDHTLLAAVSLIAPLALKAQSPSSAYEFRTVIEPGTPIAGHTFTDDTIFGSVALADNGDFAFIAHWKDIVDHEAIFTSKSLVASADETVDGKYIRAIPLDAKLAINALGQVAYTAFFSDYPPEYSFHGVTAGLFLDRHFVLAPVLNPIDFELDDDGRLVNEQTSPTHFGHTTCGLPTFPLPTTWSTALSASITSYQDDPPIKGQTTYLAVLPFLQQQIEAPYRLIYYGADCLPLMIVLGDHANGVVAVYTKAGLLAGIDPEGSLDLFRGESFIQIPQEPFTRKVPQFSMSRTGQVLLPVDHALYLLTPKPAGVK